MWFIMVKYIFLFLIIPSICFSEIKGFIESGKDISDNVFYSEMQIGYNYKWFYLYGNQITWFEFNNNSGQPFRDIYTIGFDFKFENIIFNIQHFCSHQVVSEREQNHRYNDIPLGGQMTKISARYEF